MDSFPLFILGMSATMSLQYLFSGRLVEFVALAIIQLFIVGCAPSEDS